MDQQADLLERAGTVMRDPLTAFRSASDEAPADTHDAAEQSEDEETSR